MHKQFNSPLGLYSNENVQEVLAQQTGIIPWVQPQHKYFVPLAFVDFHLKFSAQPGRKLDMKNSETLRALMEENEKNNKSAAQRDVRGLKEVRPAAPVKTVASNPYFKVSHHHIVYMSFVECSTWYCVDSRERHTMNNVCVGNVYHKRFDLSIDF